MGLIRKADLCVHAGDIGIAAVIQELESENLPVIAVLGNNDIATKWPANDRNLLKKIPDQQAVGLPGG